MAKQQERTMMIVQNKLSGGTAATSSLTSHSSVSHAEHSSDQHFLLTRYHIFFWHTSFPLRAMGCLPSLPARASAQLRSEPNHFSDENNLNDSSENVPSDHDGTDGNEPAIHLQNFSPPQESAATDQSNHLRPSHVQFCSPGNNHMEDIERRIFSSRNLNQGVPHVNEDTIEVAPLSR